MLVILKLVGSDALQLRVDEREERASFARKDRPKRMGTPLKWLARVWGGGFGVLPVISIFDFGFFIFRFSMPAIKKGSKKKGGPLLFPPSYRLSCSLSESNISNSAVVWPKTYVSRRFYPSHTRGSAGLLQSLLDTR